MARRRLWPNTGVAASRTVGRLPGSGPVMPILVVQQTTLRPLLAIAASGDRPLERLDVERFVSRGYGQRAPSSGLVFVRRDEPAD